MIRNSEYLSLSIRKSTSLTKDKILVISKRIKSDIKNLENKLKEKTFFGNVASLFGLLDDKQSSAILCSDSGSMDKMPKRKYSP